MLNSKRSKSLSIIAAALAGGLGITASGATITSFTPGDLVIYRVGDGTAGLTSASTAVFLDEYTPTGTLVGSLPMPAAASGTNNPLTASGTATSEGLLTLSTNGGKLIITGYAAAPGTAAIAGTATTAVTRAIGEVDANANIDTTTTTTSFTGNNIRSATSIDGSTVWASGANSGVIATPDGGSGTGTVVSSTVANLRQLNIFGGQLYTSTSSGSAVRIGAVGTGTPTATGQTTASLAGLPTTGTASTPIDSPYSYYLTQLNSSSTGPDTLYIADDSLTNSIGGGNVGEILKYSLVGGTWTANGALAATAVRGLTGVTVGGTVDLFATTGGNAAAGGGTLYGLVDSSGYDTTISGTVNSLATATTDEAFRGIAFAPIAVPEPTTLSVLAISALSLLGRRRRSV